MIDLDEIREYLKWPDRLTDTGARHIRSLVAEVKRLRAELKGADESRFLWKQKALTAVRSRPADIPTCCACGELITGEPVWHQGCEDIEVNAMRLVCLAAVQWKLAGDAVSDFDKNAYTPLPAVLTSAIAELREESERRTRLVDTRLKAQVVFWNAVEALGWHNQERNRPCPRS